MFYLLMYPVVLKQDWFKGLLLHWQGCLRLPAFQIAGHMFASGYGCAIQLRSLALSYSVLLVV